MTYTELEQETLAQPMDLVAHCLERGVNAVLVPAGALPGEFFDLSTGWAGECAQKLVNYGIRMAAIVPDLAARSERFREFAHEANRGNKFRFFPDRATAAAWLESA